MPTLPPTQPNSPAKLKPLHFTNNAASSLKNIKHNTKIKTNKKEKIKKKKKTTLKQKGKNETDQCPAPKRRRKSRAQFVVKLFDLLQSGQHAKIVSWYKDAFVIWNRQEFANKVLPTLFNHSNFSSFERQMNFYSFSKMAVDAELPSKRRMKKTDPSKFKHRLFTQHSTPEDVEKISRTTSPNQKVEVVETLRLTKARNAIMASKIAVLELEAKRLRKLLDTLAPIRPPSPVLPALSPVPMMCMSPQKQLALARLDSSTIPSTGKRKKGKLKKSKKETKKSHKRKCMASTASAASDEEIDLDDIISMESMFPSNDFEQLQHIPSIPSIQRASSINVNAWNIFEELENNNENLDNLDTFVFNSSSSFSTDDTAEHDDDVTMDSVIDEWEIIDADEETEKEHRSKFGGRIEL